MTKYGDKNNSLKSLFGKTNSQGSGPSKFVSSASLDSLGTQIESADYIRAEIKDKERIVPTVDFSAPSRFAKYGSAEKYYEDSFTYIYSLYPYDGSLAEKLQWRNSGSYIDLYIFYNK
mgnify:CR=1 FL=1